MTVLAPTGSAPQPRSGAAARPRRHRSSVTGSAPRRSTGVIIITVIAVIFVIPIIAMLEFSFRTSTGHGVEHWTGLIDPSNERAYRPLYKGLTASLILSIVAILVVLVLLLPTMILVRLRFPKLRRWLELVCLIPIAVPAIALVVGFAPVYSVMVRVLGSGAWSLGLLYGVLVLPFASRAISANLQALDVTTLVEAARSLGASWFRVFFGVLLPNLRRGLLAASFISLAVVLGEYTVASLLNQQNLQVAIVSMGKSDPYVAVIFAFLALFIVTVLLLAIGKFAAPRSRRKKRA